MATDSIMAGLFATPEQYQQAQRQQALASGMEMAKLSPVERAAAMGYAGAAQVGQGIAGALGAQDPMLQRQAARQSILKGVDQTSATSMREAAQKLADMGDLQGASALAQQSVAIQAKIDEKQAQRASMEAMAAGRNETALQIADLRAQMAQATSGLQAQFIQAKIDALQAKQERGPNVDDKAATRIGQNTMFDTLISEGDKLTGVIDKNKDAFTLGGRAATAVKSVMNPSAESVSAVSDVDSYMKKARNAYLLAAKGTQTEGDAQRAWDEFAGKLDFSSAEGAKRSIGRIKTELETQRQANDAYLKSRGISSGAALGTKDNPIKLK